MRVRLTSDALLDLSEIAEWVGQDDWDRAETLVQLLREKCTTLSRYPRRNPKVRGLSKHGIRKMAHRDYLIFYRIVSSEVEVVRIVHGARDWAALLSEGA